jgi:hypothetical protein
LRSQKLLVKKDENIMRTKQDNTDDLERNRKAVETLTVQMAENPGGETPEQGTALQALMRDHHVLLEEKGQMQGRIEAMRNMGGVCAPGELPMVGSDGAKAGAWSGAFRKAMQDRGLNFKAFLTPSGSVGLPVGSSFIPGQNERYTSLLQVLPTEILNGTDGIEYIREVTRTHAAAVVAAGGDKPVSTYELEKITDRTKMIAHLSGPIPRQYFSNERSLERYLDTVMRLGLDLGIEGECLIGSGQGEHLQGMQTVSGRISQIFDSDILKTSRKARTDLELVNVPLEAMVYGMNPVDWETACLMESSTSGEYKMTGAPIDKGLQQLWGVGVVLSTKITQGSGLLFDKYAVKLFLGGSPQLMWSENMVTAEGDSYFGKNLIALRAEQPACLAIYVPGHIVDISLEAGS